MSAIIVTLKYDPIWKALDWAKKHCPSYITNDASLANELSDRVYYINYYFGNEQDAIIFKLKWS
jgi:hypothetical protein